MDGLEIDLRLAGSRTVETVYENATGASEDVLLGKGRCNEVRMARRRSRSTLSNTKLPTIDSYLPPSRRHSIDSIHHTNPTRCLSASIHAFNETNTTTTFTTGNITSTTTLMETAEPRSGESSGGLDNSLSKVSIPEDYYALKIISKEAYFKRVSQGKERSDALVREVVAQALVCQLASSQIDNNKDNTLNAQLEDHFPIVKLYGCLETFDDFTLELELMKNKDLFDQLSSDGVFNESIVREVALQLTLASKLCMSVGIAHRDIKLSNITFPRDDHSSTNTPSNYKFNYKIKVADFGMAGFRDKDNLLRGRCGTPGYVAPDILKAGVHEGYHMNVDMFSIGVVCYTLLCGYEPFYGTDDTSLIKANKNVNYEFHLPEWGDISDDAKDWIRNCMSPYANARLKPEEALEHPWLSRDLSRHPLVKYTYVGNGWTDWDGIKLNSIASYDLCMRAIRLSKVTII